MVVDLEPKQIELLLEYGLNVSEIRHLIERYFYPDELIKLDAVLSTAKDANKEKITYREIKNLSLEIYLWHLIKDNNTSDGNVLVNNSYKYHGDWLETLKHIESDLNIHQIKHENIQSKIKVDIGFEAEPLCFWGGKPDLAEMALMMKEDGFYNFYNCSCGVPGCGAATPGCFVLHRDGKTFFIAPDDCIELDRGYYIFYIGSSSLIQSFNSFFRKIGELVSLSGRIKSLDPNYDIESDINLHSGFNMIKSEMW